MKSLILIFLSDEEGLTTVEYAIAAGVIIAGLAGVFALLGTNVSSRIGALQALVGS